MRILHTSDWHLGHTLHDFPREEEHRLFLDWLLELVGERDVDFLVVAGDVFDTANPPATAQRAFFRFAAELHRRHPGVRSVVVGGNHDSAARLDAPSEVLLGCGVSVVGGVPRLPGGGIDVHRLLVPLTDRGGRERGVVAAVPFLREVDLPSGSEAEDDRLVAGVRRVYAQALEAARARLPRDGALVATGHCYMVGTALSELSERRVLGGNQHALPADVFPEDVTYAALGHLHLAQRVGGREAVRYSGSPIPLALDEADYPHQVCVVELDGPRLAGVEAVAVPRAVDIVRVPGKGHLPVEDALDRLRGLAAADPAVPEGRRPWLEVKVRLAAPEPALRRRVEEALAGRAPRLVRLAVELAGTGRALGDVAGLAGLDGLDPARVFALRYARSHPGEPPPELMAAFHELVEAVQAGAGGA